MALLPSVLSSAMLVTDLHDWMHACMMYHHQITMDISKPLPSDLSQSRIICKFKNLNPSQLENLVFQAAVPKYLKLEMLPPSSTTIHPANSLSAEVTQEIRLTNSMQGQKSIMLKLKIGYKQGQLTVS